MNPLLNVKYIKTPLNKLKNKKKLNVLGSKGRVMIPGCQIGGLTSCPLRDFPVSCQSYCPQTPPPTETQGVV